MQLIIDLPPHLTHHLGAVHITNPALQGALRKYEQQIEELRDLIRRTVELDIRHDFGGENHLYKVGALLAELIQREVAKSRSQAGEHPIVGEDVLQHVRRINELAQDLQRLLSEDNVAAPVTHLRLLPK